MNINDNIWIGDIIKTPIMPIKYHSCNWAASRAHCACKTGDVVEFEKIMKSLIPQIQAVFDAAYAELQRPIVCGEHLRVMVTNREASFLWYIEPKGMKYDKEWFEKNKATKSEKSFSLTGGLASWGI